MAHPKGALIERLQKEGRQPRFETRSSGPDHEPEFESEVLVGGEVLGRGRGPNKRTAERRAAEEALRGLEERRDEDAAPRAAAADEGDEGDEGVDEGDVAEPAPLADGPFEGPWPVFESVLATALRIGHERVDPKATGDAAREAIGAFALTLYKDVLEDLGDVVEVDEEDED